MKITVVEYQSRRQRDTREYITTQKDKQESKYRNSLRSKFGLVLLPSVKPKLGIRNNSMSGWYAAWSSVLGTFAPDVCESVPMEVPEPLALLALAKSLVVTCPVPSAAGAIGKPLKAAIPVRTAASKCCAVESAV